MQSERGTIFGPLGFVERLTARSLGFNNDGATPSAWVSREIGEGEIYHTKTWRDKNIVVASVVLKEETEPSFYFRTFDGLQPTEMDGIRDPEERKRLYDEWLNQFAEVVSPEFKVTPDTLRKKLEKLSREL